MADIGLVVLDRAEGLRRVGGDEKLYRELIVVFVRDLPRLQGQIETAIVQTSASVLQCAGHALKGSASQIGARAIAGHAGELEEIGRRGVFTEVRAAHQRLTEALTEFLAAVGAQSGEGRLA